MSRFFYSLTPDTVLEAVESSGFSPTGHILTLNSYENRVYDLKLENEEHIIAKFYRPGRWTEEQILKEHEFLFELVRDEVPACAPMKFPDGNSLHRTDEIYYAVWPRTGGRSADEFSDEDMLSLGRLIGRIHNTGARSRETARPVLNAETYGTDALSFLESNNFLPGGIKDRYASAVRTVCEIYGELSLDVPLHRIHGDCHPGNLLHSGQGWFFLDFDDFVTGPAVQDLWMLAGAHDRESERHMQLLIEGYRQFREFDESWTALIEPLRALRYIHYTEWLAKRWEDPVFQQYFSHFGTEQYWEEETKNLEDQIAQIRNQNSSIAALPEEEPQEELTNKDFFWDLEE